MPRRFDPAYALRVAATLAISAAGGFLFEMFGMPAGWIAGGLLAVAIASLAGLNTDVPEPMRAAVYLVLGIVAGTGVSQETLHQMQTWPASFAILGVSLVIMVAGAYWWLHDRAGWDRDSAILASLPGALSFVIAVAERSQADMKKVAIAQSIRLILLIQFIPLLALLIDHPSGSLPAGDAPIATPAEMAMLLVTGLAAALVLERMRFPGGWMLGGLLATAVLLLTEIVEGRLPGFLVVPCTIALAAITGSRFRPGDLVVLPRIAGPALAAFAIATAISVVAAGSVTLLLGVDFIQSLMAFAPGALDALIILAFAMNIDPAYVAAHHVVRFMALVALVPLLARWLNRHP